MKNKTRDKICEILTQAKEYGFMDRVGGLVDYIETRTNRGDMPAIVLPSFAFTYRDSLLKELNDGEYKEKFAFSCFDTQHGDFISINFQLTPTVDLFVSGWLKEDDTIMYQAAFSCYRGDADLQLMNDFLDKFEHLRTEDEPERTMNGFGQ